MYYSKNGEYPTQLPNRLKFADGSTRTDKSTFTADEIAAAGYVAVDAPPQAQYPNRLEWSGTEWVVRPPNDHEINARWHQIRNRCTIMLSETDYKVIKAVEAGVSVDPAVVAYRQALRDLYNNVNDVDPWTVEMPALESDEIEGT